MDTVRDAIAIIKRQGEEANASPEDTGTGDLVHFCRFGEIRFRKMLKKDPATEKWNFNGENVEFPAVFPVAIMPSGGYRNTEVSADVRILLETFDHNYTNLLNKLQAAWQSGSLGAAVGAMFSLKSTVVELMAIEIPNGKGNYGPCFRLV